MNDYRESIGEKPSPQYKLQLQKVLRGEGQGAGQDYRPFLPLGRRGFQSRGRSHLPFYHRFGRQVHLLSDLELACYLTVSTLQDAEVREQVPLEPNDFELALRTDFRSHATGTLAICRKLGIHHPRFRVNEPRLLTTDLVVYRGGVPKFALYVKYQDDLNSLTERQRKLLEVEKAYWKSRGATFYVVTENNETKEYRDLLQWAVDGLRWTQCTESVVRLLTMLKTTDCTLSLGDRLHACRVKLGHGSDDAVTMFKYAILARLWRPTSSGQELDLNVPWSGRIYPPTADLQQVPYLRLKR